MSSACSPTSSRTRISAVTSSRAGLAPGGRAIRCGGRRALAPIVLALAGGMVLGCGKKGPPLPIIRVTPALPGPLKVRQIGSDVVLASPLAGTRSDGTRLDADAELRVLRMPATASLQPGAVSDRYLVGQFDKQARPVADPSGSSP